MAQLFETLCMMLAFKESHSLAVHYCRLVWDVRSLSQLFTAAGGWKNHRGGEQPHCRREYGAGRAAGTEL